MSEDKPTIVHPKMIILSSFVTCITQRCINEINDAKSTTFEPFTEERKSNKFEAT